MVEDCLVPDISIPAYVCLRCKQAQLAATKAATPKGLSELQERLLGYAQAESKD